MSFHLRYRIASVAIAASLALLLEASASAQTELQAWNETGDEISMPLVEERLTVLIDRQHAQTRLEQTYQNETPAQVEGRYTLMAGEGARVIGFAYWNGEEKIVGEVFEKDAAQAVYSEITGFGRDPGLLEETGEGAFSFRVFPIAAGERKRVQIDYGRWLKQVGDQIEFRAPVRSATAVKLELREDRPIVGLSSPTHQVTQRALGDGRYAIVVGAPSDPKTNELVLQYRVPNDAWRLDARVHRDAGHDPYLVLRTSTPESASRSQTLQKDVTLVIDRSGSMQGQPLAQARTAAIDLVRRLKQGDRVNIVAFDDATESLYEKPRTIDRAVRAEAEAYIGRIDDQGGTNIAGALEAALTAQHPRAKDRPQIVLFLTDGQSDSSEALRAAKRVAGDARIYTVGVGPGVQRPLLSRLASEHRGRFTFIPSAAAIASSMAGLYERLASPVAIDLQIEIEGVRAHHRYPQTLPDLYAGDELVVATRLLSAGKARARLRGRIDGRPFEVTREIEIPNEIAAPWVARTWASKRVDEVLEAIALEGETEGRKDEVIELALAYAFTTPYTSFLAIPESELVGDVAERVSELRAQRQAILKANPDAAALSRSAMPPGDPVLHVLAPASARQVTAYFPFGLVQDLEYDATEERWSCRFLVPNSVIDGSYHVRVLVVDENGSASISDVPYVIDSDEPEVQVELEATETPGEIRVVVRELEPLRRASVALVDDPSVRVELRRDGSAWIGELALAPGSHELRIVVADAARNEGEVLRTAEVAR